MKMLGVIFSNIHDKDLGELTANRTIASVPFGGRYRLIDFVLSNMVNSGITKVGVITKANYQSLMDHIGSGKNWDLSRKNGGIMVLPPFGVGSDQQPYSSRFQAIKNIETFIRRSTEDYIVMSDCDNVCNIDFASVLEYHKQKAADITIVYRKKKIPASDKKQRVVYDFDASGRAIKGQQSDKLSGDYNVYTNIMLINRTFLLNLIDSERDYGIKSFAEDILIKGVKEIKIFGYCHDGFFASINSIANYFKHSMDLLDREKSALLFDNQGAMIYTKVRDSAPCRLLSGAVVNNSMIADGCVIDGTVRNSILFRGVKVGKGVIIENSIIFQDTVIGAGSKLNCVIADKQAIILENRALSGHESRPYFITKGCVI